jgi:hypothetical protein
LDDINEDVRGQGVMSLSILGIKGKSLLNQLLDILELDSSIFVRIQVISSISDILTKIFHSMFLTKILSN